MILVLFSEKVQSGSHQEWILNRVQDDGSRAFYRSPALTKVIALPVLPARPVRPIRWI